jgi:mono/diheme cytochrome c family protein
MKKALKVVGIILVVAVGGLAVFVATFKPRQRAAATETIERTPERVEHGRYLVESVLGCMDCHSRRDMSRFGGPLAGPAGAGGECLGPEAGAPGRICAPNITPDSETGLGAWSDGEILRAIREGVDRQGQALFPMMPYTEYAALSDEDARAVVAYLRSLPPVKNAVPDSELGFPVSFFIKMAPQPLAGPVPEPDRADRVAYGKYLARVGGCQFCHTPIDDKHRPLAGQEFSGGHDFKLPGGAVVRSANITPHATGLGGRDEEAFVGMFKAFALPEADLPRVALGQNTAMPWLSLAHMTEPDLRAIYAYLRTVKPIDRVVDKRPHPPMPTAPSTAATGAPTAPTP